MKKQRGIISMAYLYGAIAVVIVGLGVATKVQTSRLNAETAQYEKLTAQYGEFVAATEATGKAQNIQTAKTKEDNHEQNLIIAQAYGDDLNRLNSNLDRLRHTPTRPGGSGLSSPAINPSGLHTPVAQSGSVGQGACDAGGFDPCVVTRSFFENALNDAMDWDSVQGWLARQRIPVE